MKREFGEREHIKSGSRKWATSSVPPVKNGGKGVTEDFQGLGFDKNWKIFIKCPRVENQLSIKSVKKIPSKVVPAHFLQAFKLVTPSLSPPRLPDPQNKFTDGAL